MYCGDCCGLLIPAKDYSYVKCTKCGNIMWNKYYSSARNTYKTKIKEKK